MALMGYFYAYIPPLLGVVGLAAGVKLTLGAVGERVALAPALLLAGGVAAYLRGDLAFRRALCMPVGHFRLAAALAALATAGLGSWSTGLRSSWACSSRWWRCS